MYKYVRVPVDIYLRISMSSTPLQWSHELRTRARAPKSIQDCSWCQVCGSNGDVVDRRVVLRYIVALVISARHPIMPKLELRDTIAKPMETHVHGIRSLGGDCVVDHAEGRGVVRLHWGGGLGMAHFGECVCRAGIAARHLMYRAPILASAADDMTALMICETARTPPLFGGLAELFERKKWPSARLRAPDSERCDALECTARIMSLAWKVTMASG